MFPSLIPARLQNCKEAQDKLQTSLQSTLQTDEFKDLRSVLISVTVGKHDAETQGLLSLSAEISDAARHYLQCAAEDEEAQNKDVQKVRAEYSYDQVQSWMLSSKALNEVVSSALTAVLKTRMEAWVKELKEEDAFPLELRVLSFWEVQGEMYSCLGELNKEMKALLEAESKGGPPCLDQLYERFQGDKSVDKDEYESWQRWMRFAVKTWQNKPDILKKEGLNWKFCSCNPRDDRHSSVDDPSRCEEELDGRRRLCAFHSLPPFAQAFMPMLTLKNSVLKHGALVDKWDVRQKLVLLQSKLFPKGVNGLARNIQKNCGLVTKCQMLEI